MEDSLFIPITSVNTYYRVSYEGFSGSFAPEDYSKYTDRWRECIKKQIMPWDVYGYAQALEHIDELRESVYQGKKQYEHTRFFVLVETRIVTSIPV